MMLHPRLVRGKRLRETLGVSDDTLRRWAQINYLRPIANIGGEPHYAHDDVTVILAEGARNYTTPPTAADLIGNKIKLVPGRHAAHMVGRAQTTLPAIVANGHLRAIKFYSNYGYDLDSIREYIDVEDDESRISYADTRLALGARWFLKQLISQGALAKTTHPHKPHLRPIDRASLLAYLKRPGILPDWVTAEDWLEDRAANRKPLLTTGSAAVQLGIWRGLLKPLFDSRELKFIRPTGGRRILVPPESIEAYLAYSEPLSLNDAGKIFVMTGAGVWMAREEGRLICPLHDHTDNPSWQRPCVIAILHGMLTPGTSPHRWYDGRAYGNEPTVTLAEAADILNVSTEETRNMAEAGELHGLCLGGARPRWAFSRSHVSHVRRQRN